ncbi:MAG: hypothetical protein ACRC46_10500 [Thermoguttaceae bacterium]
MNVYILFILTSLFATASPASANEFISPTSVVAAPNGETFYVVCTDADEVAVVTREKCTIKKFATSPHPTSLVVSVDGEKVLVSSGVAEGLLEEFDAASGERLRSVAAGHSPTGLSITAGGEQIFVCNRFASTVRQYDTKTLTLQKEYRVGREPTSSVVTRDDGLVFVACALPNRPLHDATNSVYTLNETAADVACIDLATSEVKLIPLVSGSHSLRGMALSPDGYHLYITGHIGRFHSPTLRIERGWINTNALHIIDVTSRSYFNTVLLDEATRGAADPAGVACTADGKKIVVALGGTHELLVINSEAMWDRILRLPYNGEGVAVMSYWGHDSTRMTSELPNDLAFLNGIRKRIPLEGQGARGVAVVGNNTVGDTAVVAMQFADTICRVNLKTDAVETISLGTVATPDAVRRGEMAWNDATLSRESWLSCATCHPDARTDGLAWDLLNDGIGNHKAVKSLLNSDRTPPSMWHGVRASSAVAIRTGFQFIEFSEPDESICTDIESYLASLVPVPSPFLVGGKLSDAAVRGKDLFESPRLGCTLCHPAPLFTDLRKHDVGSRNAADIADTFDTPSLVEIWRTAPYLHDGRTTSLADLFTREKHGTATTLTEHEVADVVAYLLSL